ncbi:MAG: hypothetical protein MUF75_05965 [Bacteroidia bacterium]|nr:hypothetical protein [Bacteroidia bacterium]
MKSITRFVAIALVSGIGFFGVSCKSDTEKQANPEADSLKTVAGELTSQLNEKEAALQEFIASFNEIQENLNAIKEKEKIVVNASEKGDVKKKEDQIKEDIQSIYDLMSKNKNRINSLSKKLKDANLKIEGMDQMIANMQATIDQKDVEISDLKTRIEGLNIELSNLNTNYKMVEAESAEKTEIINTAFYAIGTSKELIEKKVITKEGGFIGIGKSAKMQNDFNKDYFTKINAEQTQSINIGAKKVKLLSTHPSGSYKLVGEKPVQKIDITNPKEFWSVSKYLVIVIEQ